MPDIFHRVGIKAAPKKVFNALTTIDGLRHWWVSATTGDAQSGGLINFGFCEMKVTATRPGRFVKWKCVSGPREWLGTEVTFRLQSKQGQTFVLFTHAGWKKPVEFMHFEFNFVVRQNMHLISNSLYEIRHFCFDANHYPTGRRGLRRNRNVWRAASSDLSHWQLESKHHCSTKWATFLLSLRDSLERNQGRPAPHDLKIHVGD